MFPCLRDSTRFTARTLRKTSLPARSSDRGHCFSAHDSRCRGLPRSGRRSLRLRRAREFAAAKTPAQIGRKQVLPPVIRNLSTITDFRNMETVCRRLPMISIGQAKSLDAIEAARGLFVEYGALPDVNIPRHEIAGLPGEYAPPSGALLIAMDGEAAAGCVALRRSEEHTSELQSQFHLVCRLLLEKKNQRRRIPPRAPGCVHCAVPPVPDLLCAEYLHSEGPLHPLPLLRLHLHILHSHPIHPSLAP